MHKRNMLLLQAQAQGQPLKLEVPRSRKKQGEGDPKLKALQKTKNTQWQQATTSHTTDSMIQKLN